MKTGLSITCAGLVAGMLAWTPAPSYAGDSEWATAGKILTGVVAVNVLGGLVPGLDWRRPREPVRTVVYTRHYGPPAVARRPHHPVACRPVVVTPRPCREPIIRRLGDGRRLYQKPIHGAPAYLQVWSDVKYDWVDIKTCPSIW